MVPSNQNCLTFGWKQVYFLLLYLDLLWANLVLITCQWLHWPSSVTCMSLFHLTQRTCSDVRIVLLLLMLHKTNVQSTPARTISADLECGGCLSPRLGPHSICLAEYEQDRLLIHAKRRQRQIDPSLPHAHLNAPTGMQTSVLKCMHTHTYTHAHIYQHDRWEKTQRSAVSRASLRQDSGSFTSPWLRRLSWPKAIHGRCSLTYSRGQQPF